MSKYIYRFFILLFIFCGAVFFFSKGIREVSIDATGSVSMSDSSFPILRLQLGSFVLNTMHGYSSNIAAKEVRESITPLDFDKDFELLIEEKNSTIKKLKYELRSISDNQLLDSGSLTVFDKKKEYRTASIKLNASLDTSTEYGLKFTITTSSSKKIHYYTRVKYYEQDFFLKEKLNFVNQFHTQTYKKENPEFISGCLETSSEADNSSFSKVTIQSSYNMVTWDGLKPKIITDVYPVIKELNIETAAIQLDYFVTAKTDSGRELFHVKEFYRVRYATDRMYMLYFERTMETIFNPAHTSLRKSQFLLGITNQEDYDITSSDDNKKMAFVRGGSLWYYNLEKESLTSIFSFDYGSDDYERDLYDKHDIHILKMDDDGNIRFAVYGYMNRGDYEGRVAVLLYDYDAKTGQILERVYIPLTTTFDKLNQDFGEFCYVNDKDIFYFTIDNIVFAYNIASKKYETLASHITDNNFLVIENTTSFIWADAMKTEKTKSITIMNLETEEISTISASKNDNVTLLGTIDDNIIYGFIHHKDIARADNGDLLIPCYKVIISDCEGNILKTYTKKGCYVTDLNVHNNIITMERVKKSGGGYKKIGNDSILNQVIKSNKSFGLTTRTTDLTKTEYYITMPSGYKMSKQPELITTKNTIVTEDTTLHLDEKKLQQEKYYIYAHGGITHATQDVADAILQADEEMGVVLDRESRLVWERGGKYLSKTMSGITPVYATNGISSQAACVSMLLQAAQITKEASSLSQNASAMKLLQDELKKPVNLTDCTLDEVLYFTSQSKGVITMKDSTHAVLLTAYNSSSVTFIDPAACMTSTMSLTAAEEMFKNAGSIYISYLE